jgi:hypothetical protein
MLAMQAQPKVLDDASAATAMDPNAPQQQRVQPSVAQAPGAAANAAGSPVGTAGTAATPPAAKPVVVLLDVHLEAPVLLMPLSSGSDDLMELDLGELQLKNLVVWEMRSEDKDRQKLLVDEMQVSKGTLHPAPMQPGELGRRLPQCVGYSAEKYSGWLGVTQLAAREGSWA